MPLPRRSHDRSLNPELERLIYQEKVILQEAEGLYWGLTDNQLNWTPEPGQWSVAQCLDHTNITNDKLSEKIDIAIKSARASGMLSEGPFTYGFVARWFLRLLLPPVKRRFKAPKGAQPGVRRAAADVVPKWEKTHHRLTDQLKDSDGIDLARTKVSSPFNNLLKYPLGMAFWIQTAHDRRHLWQARQIRNHPNFPSQ